MTLTSQYMFSIDTAFPTRWVGETPAGYRIDVEYRGSGRPDEISTDNKKLVADHGLRALYDTLRGTGRNDTDDQVVTRLRAEYADGRPDRPWLGLEGRVVSGVDWALLRADGVIEFDGQFVISDRLAPDPDAKGVLVNARTSGAVDLFPGPSARPLSLQHCVDRVKAIGPKEHVGIALSVKFEAPGESEPWASKKYTRKKGQLRYIELSRGQFIAKGKLTSFGNAGASVRLDVFQIEVDPPGNNP